MSPPRDPVRVAAITVSDTNLDYWKLERALAGSDAFTLLASGTGSVNKAALAVFDPAALANGVYRLRLTAADISGRVSSTETPGTRCTRAG